VPMLAKLIERETAKSFDLVNSVTIEVVTASYRSNSRLHFGRLPARRSHFGRQMIPPSRTMRSYTRGLRSARPGRNPKTGSVVVSRRRPMLRSGRDEKCTVVSIRIFNRKGCYYTQCVKISIGAD